MSEPTILDLLDILIEQTGMSRMQVVNILKVPLHPQTMRDEFARAAMNGICSSGPGEHMTNALIAKEAYDIADEMLKHRVA